MLLIFMDNSQEEKRDVDAVEQMLKKYSTGIKYLFSKYNYTGGVF